MFFFILICSLKGGFITLEDYAFVDLILFISKAFFYINLAISVSGFAF